MTQHTPEPWQRSRFVFHRRYPIMVAEGLNLEADLNRIIACVNACAGMTDPEDEITRLRQDKAELLATAEPVRVHLNTLVQLERIKLENSDPSNQGTAAFLSLSNAVDDFESAIAKATP